MIRLNQEVNISEETICPKILLLGYTKALSKCDGIKAFIAPKMID